MSRISNVIAHIFDDPRDSELFKTIFMSKDGLPLFKIIRTKDGSGNVKFEFSIDGAYNPYSKQDEVALKQDKIDTDLDTSDKTIVGGINETYQMVKSSAKGIVFNSYQDMVDAFNLLDGMEYNIGQNAYIIDLDVPDLWVSGVEEVSVPYTYTTDQAIIEALNETGYIQIGYYTLSKLETSKIDLNEYAKIDGFYEQMIVGLAIKAKEIASQRLINNAESSCPPIVFGTVGGEAEIQDGYSEFQELRGKTVLWNQLIENGNFEYDLNGWRASNTATASTSGGLCTLTAKTDVDSIALWKEGLLIKAGHTYLFKITKDVSGLTNFSACSLYSFDLSLEPVDYESLSSNLGDSLIFTATKDGNSLRIKFDKGSDPYITGSAIISNVQIFDITAGKLPSTVDKFNEDYPKDYYEYNPGTFMSCRSYSLIVRGKNQFSGLDEFIRVIPDTEYELSGITDGSIEEYDIDKNFIDSTTITQKEDITLSDKTHYVKIKADVHENIMFYIAFETYEASFVPYDSQIIRLPNIPLLSLGDVYDVAYRAGGGVRKIGVRDYEEGDESDSSVWTNGTTTLYILSEPEDISVNENPGWKEYIDCNNYGTYEFTTTSDAVPQIPQPYFVKYTVNLTEFLDSLYVEAGGDPSGLSPVKGVSVGMDETGLTPNSNGIVNIPEFTVPPEAGHPVGPCLVRLSNPYTTGITTGGNPYVPNAKGPLKLYQATNSEINNRTADWYNGAIVLHNLDYAVKAAMTDGIGTVWEDAERIAALARMGCTVDENGFVKWTATPGQE